MPFLDAFFAVLGLLVDLVRHYWQKVRLAGRPSAKLRHALARAQDFQQWEDVAERLDYELGHDLWRKNPRSKKYDYRVIEARLAALRKARSEEDVETLVDLLRSGLLRNLANISDKTLFNYSYLGTKILIEQYISEVMHCLTYVRRAKPAQRLPLEKKLQFLKDTRHSYGLSALVLQGGASFGMFHLGVCRALWEAELLPKIISGSAIGALVAALVCKATDEEMRDLLYEDQINLNAFERRGTSGQTMRKIKRFLRQGFLLDISVLGELCRDNLGDLTFEEAYLRTNRVLNITIHSGPSATPNLLNYLTAPNVLIWSAALASNALPGLYESVELLCKDENDEIQAWMPFSGVRWTRPITATSETPFDRISELFNVNNFIVSQARPYLAPLLSSPLHRHHRRGAYLKLIRLFGLELQHRLSQFSKIGLTPKLLNRWLASEFAPSKSRLEIMLVPSLNVQDFFKIFKSPTHESIRYWIDKGERATWPAINLLRVRQLIEVTLSELYEDARREEEDQQGFRVEGGLRGGLSTHFSSDRANGALSMHLVPNHANGNASFNANGGSSYTVGSIPHYENDRKRTSRRRSRTVDGIDSLKN